MKDSVTKAVLPAAGKGTSILPLTYAVPKEMLPLVDRPALDHLVRMVASLGVQDILVIVSPSKEVIPRYFEYFETMARMTESAELELHLEFCVQEDPDGFGAAISLAEPFVADESFFVIVPDEIPDSSESLLQMANVHLATSASVLCVREVPWDDISRYGCIDPGPRSETAIRVRRVVEKPSRDSAPSNLAVTSAFVLTPDIFPILRSLPRDVRGEIELADALDILAQREPVEAVLHHGAIYDLGQKLDYAKAFATMALLDREIGRDFNTFLQSLVEPTRAAR